MSQHPNDMLVPVDNSSQAPASAMVSEAELKRQRLAKQREARAEYDTVTVGRPKKPAPKTAPSQSQPAHASELDAAPVYRFQIAEAFENDVPNMRAPRGVKTKSLSTTVDRSRKGRKVIPLPGQAGTPDLEGPTSTALTTVGTSHQLSDPDEVLMASIQHATSKRPTKLSSEVIAPNDELDIAGLRDAEDVISYFSVHGADMAVKFVYCNQAPMSLDFRPYDLDVVPRGHQSSEHYVISASGVVHVQPGAPAEVVSLSDWMRESAMFNILRRIRFFRNYLVYKAFTQWRKNIRLRLYSQTRRALCRKFFLSKSTFATTTVELYKSAHDLTTAPLMHYEQHGKDDYTIDEFNREQSRKRSEASSEFSATLEKIETRLTKLTEMIQQRANVPDLTTMESLEQYLLANSVAAGKDKKGTKKMKSMLEAKQEQHERMRELKRSMVEHSMLDNYIRLIDYISAESIFKNALLTVMNFTGILRQQHGRDSQKMVAFQILIQPQDDQMVYRPSLEDITKMYTEMIAEVVQTVSGCIRLMNQKPLKVFFAKPPKMWNIGGEFHRDARVSATKENTYAMMQQDFKLAMEEKLNYDGCIEWVNYIKRGWPERKAEWDGRIKRGEHLTHDEIVDEYALIERALGALKNLLSRKVGYMLNINASRLNSELQPKIEAIKTEVGQKLTITARTRTRDLQRYWREQSQLLTVERRDMDLKRFAEFVDALNKVVRDQPAKDNEADEADSLFVLMGEKEVPIEDDDKQLRDRTLGGTQITNTPQREAFGDTVQRAQQFADERRAGMTKALSDKIDALEEKARVSLGALNEDEYTTIDASYFSPDARERVGDGARDWIPNLKEFEQTIAGYRTEANVYSEYQVLFDAQPVARWEDLTTLEQVFEARSKVWSLVERYDDRRRKWFETSVKQLDPDAMKDETGKMHREANDLKGIMRDREITDSVAEEIESTIAQFKRMYLPVMMDCGNPDMEPGHWERVLQKLPSGDKQYRETLCIDDLNTYGIFENPGVIATEAGIASGEASLKRQITAIADIWKAFDFETKKYREDREGVFILDKVDDVIMQLDDHHVQLQTLTAHRHVAGVRAEVEDWADKLHVVSDVIEEWTTMQKNWMYLEFIFSSPDIKVQLKAESEAFDNIDKFFLAITSKAATKKNVLTICTEQGMRETLKANNKAIDQIQKSLEDYLETKRVAFPRFYFLSNDELLSILSDVRNPRAVQPHLSKCFDSINALAFGNEKATEITGMISGEGEEVQFERVVQPAGNVEMWLGVIESTMKSSLYFHMKNTYEAYGRRKREDWFFEFPSQCIQAVDMIQWTSEAEQAIVERTTSAYRESYQQQILDTVEIVKRNLSRLQRTLVCTLIVVDVHNRDVVGKLIDAKVTDVQDFEWQQQLRYYWENDPAMGANNVGCHHSTAHLWYGYEYLGNQPRLVITPLTDRAFLTCTSALEMNLGAAPQGPAGTGKTESVKDLGKALARQVVVFNCSDGINYKTMSRMFAGLAQAGAWACFDEFNRIELEVLSVIAQQMLEIVSALSQKLENMEFDGHPIKLSKNFGVFITMNPGYAGRTELPDNLKALFRPICMMIPDYALIAEIMFYSEGFGNARQLAQKMVQLYKLSSEQLSKQPHYDFGMRAVKSILVMAGSLKRANPDHSEEMLLIRAMRDSNVPKFLRDDTVLFMALIKDLFPSTHIEDEVNQQLEQYFTNDSQANNLVPTEGFLLKTRQLYDTMLVRHGVMTVGATYCAKSTILNTLKRTLTAMKHANVDPDGATPLINVVHTHVLNPKSITMGELYGDVNPLTREWTDGLLSGIARNIKSESNVKPDRNWIVFDGPVDAIWIENMNTVLDDNKMLCLFNGERIKLPGTASFVFEVQDLKVASPATVSRCGMVFVEPFYLDSSKPGGWSPVAISTVKKLSESKNAAFRGDRVIELLDKLVPQTLQYIRRKCKEYIPSVDAQQVVSLIRLLHAFATHTESPDAPEDAEDPAAEVDTLLEEFQRPTVTAKSVPPDPKKLLDMQFVMAYVWSFGANLADASRAGFSEFAMQLLSETFPFMPSDSGRTVYDICIHRPSLSFISWDYVVPNFVYDRKLPYFDLIVPTVETTSMKFVMTHLAEISRNTLVTGVTGTGKTVVVSDLISTTLKADNPSAAWEYFATAFSAQTKSIDLQERIESKLTKVKSTLYGAAPGKRTMFFIDDLNMPQLERYGASPPIELLRQVISQGGFYERKKVPQFFKEIQDLVVFAACGIPGGGRNELTPRLTSQFHLLCEPIVTTASMRRIFSLILGGFLNIWPMEVRQLTPKIIEAARGLYERISREKLPTPAKSHYTFNLRDFGKVFQGMLQASPEANTDRDSVVRLFVHEVSRVFHDRLTDIEDRQWWWSATSEVCEAEFGLSWSSKYEDLIFGDYMRRDKRVYSEVAEISDLQDKLSEYQMNYNVDNNKETELVFFADAAHHISRICRICRQPRGNALLVGVGGSGRQSLTRLAAYMCGMPVYQIAIKRGYGVQEFRDDVKVGLLEAGCKNKPVVFLLADNQIVNEQFLEDINNILNTGEVPNMMQPEDYDQIIESVRPFVKAADKPETRGVMISHFVQLCRDNFHIVLTMSPVGELFRRRLRMFPSLVSCTTIDWFIKWPADALEGVAMRYLSRMAVVDDVKPALAKMCVKIHQDVEVNSSRFFDELRRHNYTTPTSYLELLKAYDKMYEEQVASVTAQASRLQGGLDKLAQTQVLVDEMKETLKRMQPELEQAAVDTERIMAEVATQQKEAEVVQADCSKEEAAAKVIRGEADGVRQECQEQLDEAMPAYYGALEALKTLDSKDISEMKGFAQPPERVRIVIEAVLVLLGHKDLSWNNCKAVISKSDFLSGLRNYDKDNVPEKLVRTLQKNYLSVTDKEKEFTPENIAKASQAAKSLCLWVRAIDNYNAVAKQIAPKKEQLAEAEGKLKVAEESLHAAQSKLKAVEDKVNALKRDMQANIDRKKELEDEMKLTELRLGRAGTLMSGLASEQVRWAESVSRLNKQRKELVGNMIIAAGGIAYLGPFTAPYRNRMMEQWGDTCRGFGIPCAQSTSLHDISDPVKVREWGGKGLPQDDFSIENGIMVSRSQRWCLCIDPQGQANAWIRAMERDNNLRIIKLSDPNFMKTLTQAVNVGLPVLLENIEESIDAVIDPILLRETFKAQGRTMLKLGDEEVDYDPNFRFYITTKLPNPHYMPELQIKVTIVNFTVTQGGLEEQLLADVVRYERADLEQRADGCVREIAEGKAQLKEIEERILSLLASSTGNILDNEALINALGDAKKTSQSVTQNLEIAESTQKDILATRNEYRPVATRGSLIYTVIANIAGIEHMYQYSLDFFKRLFLQTLKRTAKSDDVSVRVKTLTPAVTFDSYSTVCRGLFERDKQLFAFLMVAEIFRKTGDITDAEWQFFLKGSEGQRIAEPDSWPAWSNEFVWNEVLALSFVPGFEEVKNVVWSDEAEWSQWAADDKAYERIPSALEHLNPWQQTLIVKAFREDLLQYALTRVVGHYLGTDFTTSPAFNLDASFEDSSTTAPIIFVLTTGSDPTATFTEFADKKGFSDKKLMLSLGQDQGKKAEEMIATACQSGQWVYLQNCHVYASWMPSLERKLEDIMIKAQKDGGVHKDFRLWLTTMPTPTFPVLVLQSGIKVTKEPPRGLKANLKDSFLQEVTPELWNSCQNAVPWKRLLFSLSFFHAVIQERRKFGALGWNIAYEWNQSDYSASIKSLYTYLSDYDTVQWKALKYMIGVINYGGRVTDFLDSRCLGTLLEKFFDPESLAGRFDITPDGVYHIPADVNDLDSVKKFLDSLPPYETPELFGLHINADITFNRNASRRQLDAILSVQPRTAGAAGMTADEKVYQIADEFTTRLPEVIDKEKAHEDTYRITDDGTMVSLGTVVGQEIDVFNAIRNKLMTTLTLLKRAIHGEVVMDATLETMYTAFLIGKVPENWHADSYLSRKPLASWFEDTMQRIDFLRDWNDNGPPMSFWLPGFFFPQGFLTGVLQTHSRSCNMPIDDIEFRTHVMHMETAEQVDDPPETGVYIHGLYMEGARFNRDTNAIDESLRGELFTSIPVIWLEPVAREEVAVKSDRTYVCPLYKTTARAGALSTTGLSTNFVRSIDLNAGSKPPTHWVQRGVALLCMLDD